MRIVVRAALVSLMMTFVSLSSAQTIDVSISSGGSVVTYMEYGDRVNENSSLERQWVILNDSTCPLKLVEAGIGTRLSNNEFLYYQAGSAECSESITALEVRYLLYDVFGGHMRTLAATHVADVAPDTEILLGDCGWWKVWEENEVSELLTVVSFVANVRTAQGSVWHYQSKPITDELNGIEIQVAAGTLEPSTRAQ